MSKLYYLILVFLGFSSCKNEINIAAPWKETVVVYGLLDPGAPINYLRIQKAFLDPDGNAFQFTQNPDSIYPSNLAVKLFVRLNGNIIDTIYPVLTNGDLEGIKKIPAYLRNHRIICTKYQSPSRIQDWLVDRWRIMNMN